MEYENTILKLAADATLKPDELQRAMDMGRLIGITDTAPLDQIYSTKFVPVPTT
jgi:NitT/TauT family transport system substrate-binding protein